MSLIKRSLLRRIRRRASNSIAGRPRFSGLRGRPLGCERLEDRLLLAIDDVRIRLDMPSLVQPGDSFLLTAYVKDLRSPTDSTDPARGVASAYVDVSCTGPGTFTGLVNHGSQYNWGTSGTVAAALINDAGGVSTGLNPPSVPTAEYPLFSVTVVAGSSPGTFSAVVGVSNNPLYPIQKFIPDPAGPFIHLPEQPPDLKIDGGFCLWPFLFRKFSQPGLFLQNRAPVLERDEIIEDGLGDVVPVHEFDELFRGRPAVAVAPYREEEMVFFFIKAAGKVNMGIDDFKVVHHDVSSQ